MRLVLSFVLLSALRSSNASPLKVNVKIFVKEELDKEYVVTEVSQLVSRPRNDRIIPTYKLFSQKLRRSSPNAGHFQLQSGKWMKIDQKTGTLRFKRPFDRDSECLGSSVCTIYAQVVVMPHLIFQLAELQIVVEDVNDNRPMFPRPTLVLNISESLSEGDTINLDAYQAKDKDIGRNGALRYSTSTNDYFRVKHIVDEKNSSHLSLHVMRKPDREKISELEVDIWARDAGSPILVGEMKLEIKITDTNDNFPKFEKNVYEATFEENAPAGTILAEVKATDADRGLFGKIRYRISPKNDQSLLRLVKVDPVRGTIWIKEVLDREKHDGLRILVDALDSDPVNPKVGESWLTISVEDINDNTPTIDVEFTSQSSGDTVYVSESAPNGSYIAIVSIRDKDAGKNGETHVTLTSTAVTSNRKSAVEEGTSKYFSLSDDGFLMNSLDFDREICSRYMVQMKACDNGIPERCAKKEITVIILDENEFSPEIEETLRYIKLREDVYLGSEITTIVANDGDGTNGFALTRNETGDIVTSHNGDVKFSITEGGFGIFTIDENIGVIRLVSPLDRERKARLKLTVCARDGGFPAKESFCTIVITIEDVNDNAPIFLNPSNNNTQIYADLKSNKAITRIKAKDFDAGDNGRITYFIVRHESTTKEGTQNHQIVSSNSTLVDSYFILNPVSGDLRLNFSKENMSNAVGMHTLKIRAKDSGKISLFTEISLEVAVDKNGNGHWRAPSPEISSSWIDFLVLAISLGCATAFLVFLIIGIVIKCRRMNREINSMTKTPPKRQSVDRTVKSAKSVLAVDNTPQSIEGIDDKQAGKKDTKTRTEANDEKPPEGTFRSSTKVAVTLDVANMPHLNDNDSGRGESDIEAASLLMNEAKVHNQLRDLSRKCTDKCRIYGHSDECWMPSYDEVASPNDVDLRRPTILNYYDWDKLKPRYYTPERENQGRKGSRYSYASTSNTDNGSLVASHRSVQDDSNEGEIHYRPRYHSASSALQRYPTVPLKYAEDLGERQESLPSRYVDVVYDVNYSLHATGVCHAAEYARSQTPAMDVMSSQLSSYNVPNQYIARNISSSPTIHAYPDTNPKEWSVNVQEARAVFEGIQSLVV